MRLVTTFLLAAAVAGGAGAACPSARDMAAVACAWQGMRPVAGLDPTMSPADAECARERFVEQLMPELGAVVGYKAGLTSAAAQKRFGIDAPIRGTLLAAMLVPDGVELTGPYGTRPLFEADLIVEVGDAAIHEARTPAEVLRYLRRIHPFLELPDLALDAKETLNGATLVAINAGARRGVIGAGIVPTEAHLDALANMDVVIRDAADGDRELSRGKGSDVLGHPLNAVIWLARDIAQGGGRLKAGDLLSLGAFTPLLPPKPGMDLRVSYEGLPGARDVGVRLR